MIRGNEQAAPWCLVLTGNTTGATESEAETLQLPDVAADVFPTIHHCPQDTVYPKVSLLVGLKEVQTQVLSFYVTVIHQDQLS